MKKDVLTYVVEEESLTNEMGFNHKSALSLVYLSHLLYFVYRRGWLPPLSLDFCCKASDSYDLVLEDRYESLLSIDTKKVPVAVHLKSQ